MGFLCVSLTFLDGVAGLLCMGDVFRLAGLGEAVAGLLWEGDVLRLGECCDDFSGEFDLLAEVWLALSSVWT